MSTTPPRTFTIDDLRSLIDDPPPGIASDSKVIHAVLRALDSDTYKRIQHEESGEAITRLRAITQRDRILEDLSSIRNRVTNTLNTGIPGRAQEVTAIVASLAQAYESMVRAVKEL